MKGYRHHILLFLLLLSLPVFAFANPAGKNDSKFTVVIDAGHGGKDTGAIDNNIREKDVNLGVALQLADLIRKKLKDVNVVLTRDNDTFLSLQERADKANKAKGNLFISIHTNSVDKTNKNRTTVAGSSVYALGLHKDQNNMKVAQRENSVIELEKNYEQKYSGFDPSKDESYIIFEMAQKKNLSQSIKFADEAQKQLVSVAGRKDRGVHQAGFWVLWATSMPAVLVELDFICNPNSAKYIGSEQGQKQMAEALFNAVKTYTAPYLKKSTKGGASAFYAPLPGEDDYAYDNSEAGDQEDYQAVTEAVAASSTSRRRNTSAPERDDAYTSTYSTTSRKATSGSRRRRSASAKIKSDARNLEVAMIPLSPTEKSGESVIASAKADDTSKASASKDNGKKDKKSKKKGKGEEKVRKAFTKVYSNPNANHAHAAGRRSTHASSKANGTNMKTVYKIQLLASEDRLKDNSSCFCGLSPISSFRENNLYKYTYGESENKSEIEALLTKVKALIPEAVIIKVTKLSEKSKS